MRGHPVPYILIPAPDFHSDISVTDIKKHMRQNWRKVPTLYPTFTIVPISVENCAHYFDFKIPNCL